MNLPHKLRKPFLLRIRPKSAEKSVPKEHDIWAHPVGYVCLLHSSIFSEFIELVVVVPEDGPVLFLEIV
jgi:hypothetical protein